VLGLGGGKEWNGVQARLFELDFFCRSFIFGLALIGCWSTKFRPKKGVDVAAVLFYSLPSQSLSTTTSRQQTIMLRFVVSPRCREGFADLEVLVEEIGARHEVDFRLLRREGKAVDWTTGLERDSTLVLCLDMEQDMVLCGMDGEYNDFLKQAAARTRGRGTFLHHISFVISSR
jgi:hypothetical protein